MSDEKKPELARLMLQLLPEAGSHPSLLDGVSLLRSDQASSPTPVLQDACVIIVSQGQHCAWLGQQVFCSDAHSCLLISTPMQFVSETRPPAEGPLLAVVVRLEPSLLADLLLQMDPVPPHHERESRQGLQLCPLDAPLQDAVLRLLYSLQQAQLARVLGPGIVREIIYRILLADGGRLIPALFARHGQLRQIQRSIEHIHRHYSLPLTVPLLAEMAGMSSSAFHASFKAVTGHAPIQYLKNTRLHQARRLLLQNGHNISQAAYAVGYASPSQFSREFKRLFGQTPREDINRLQSTIPGTAATPADKGSG